MIEILSQPWPWYISGPLLAFVMFLLLFFGGEFGVSSTFRSACAIGGGGKYSDFFKYDWKSQIWNLTFVLGAIIGGFIASTYLNNPNPIALSDATISSLQKLNIEFNGGLVPDELFSIESLFTLKGLFTLIGGGFLVGFGTRWAGGCTSACYQWSIKSSVAISNRCNRLFYWWLNHDIFNFPNTFLNMKLIKYILLGIIFGIIMTKSEAISWFRIQEMFRFQSFHMYGIIGSALATGIIVVQLIKRKQMKTIDGVPITFKDKNMSVYRYLLGGTVFGLGWALSGACPGPTYTLVGHGYISYVVVLLSAVFGTYIYGLLRSKLPH